ncbi:hypothetical protein V2I01_21100 [Micromonospora sp. BRA006-A]|nr:hypothetical protein [Micromonospora sp. BRA006-A]
MLAAVAVTGLVAALAYALRSPASPPRETAPVAAPTVQAPGDQAPVVPVTGDPVSPGGPLLDVDLAPLPGSLSLTDLGTRDWRHWGGTGADSFTARRAAPARSRTRVASGSSTTRAPAIFSGPTARRRRVRRAPGGCLPARRREELHARRGRERGSAYGPVVRRHVLGRRAARPVAVQWW